MSLVDDLFYIKDSFGKYYNGSGFTDKRSDAKYYHNLNQMKPDLLMCSNKFAGLYISFENEKINKIYYAQFYK